MCNERAVSKFFEKFRWTFGNKKTKILVKTLETESNILNFDPKLTTFEKVNIHFGFLHF